MKGATLVFLAVAVFLVCSTVEPAGAKKPKVIDLPEPTLKGTVTVEETLARRRSVRSFTAEPLTIQELGQLAWAAQGITFPSRGFRTAPSAGALYPIELYVVTADGLYHYVPQEHKLRVLNESDLRGDLARAAGGQSSVRAAAADFVVTAVHERTTRKYTDRGNRYVHFEVGHVGQNIHLQAVALGLGSVPIGGFREERVKSALSLPPDHEPLYIIPVGHPVR
jgi:SagB-type dehydrogenase family enzyme